MYETDQHPRDPIRGQIKYQAETSNNPRVSYWDHYWLIPSQLTLRMETKITRLGTATDVFHDTEALATGVIDILPDVLFPFKPDKAD